MTQDPPYNVLMPVDPGEEVVEEITIETRSGMTFRFYDREAEGPSRIHDYVLFNERDVYDAEGNLVAGGSDD